MSSKTEQYICNACAPVRYPCFFVKGACYFELQLQDLRPSVEFLTHSKTDMTTDDLQLGSKMLFLKPHDKNRYALCHKMDIAVISIGRQ